MTTTIPSRNVGEVCPEKILWNKTEFHEHHQHVKHNFKINDYQKLYPDPEPGRNLTESKNRLKLVD